jgi:hypothetical protein
LRWIRLATAVVAVLLVTTACSADEGSSPSPTPESSLLGRIPPGGSLPVIVTLAGHFTAEGDLPDEHARQVQRQKISAAQTAVLAELEGFAVRDVSKFAYTPQLALTVDAAALEQLLRSKRVAAVQEDTARSQTG